MIGNALTHVPIRLISVMSVLALRVACAVKPATSRKDDLTDFAVVAEGREVTLLAIAKVNDLLKTEPPLKLRAAWIAATLEDKDAIPVDNVDVPSKNKGMICLVPPGRRVIYVEAAQIPSLPKTFSGGFKDGLDVKPEEILAVCLLHECGHIRNEDYKLLNFADPTQQYNIDATEVKRIEVKADEFAADQIKAGLQRGQPTLRFLSAANASMTAQNVSFNLLGHRVLDEFGATALRKPDALADLDYQHPNFELRFLNINYLVSGSDTARALLEDFIRLRKESVPGASGPAFSR